MSKIIFLDIDGPMIPYRAMLLKGQTRVMTLFDPVAVGMLNHLCEENGYKIVLHSTWVKVYGGEGTKDHCIQQGILPEHFHEDAYVKYLQTGRYERVAEWLMRHPEVTDYVMVDDEPFVFDTEMCPYPEGMALRLILVNYYIGFMFKTYNDIKAKLGCMTPLQQEGAKACLVEPG